MSARTLVTVAASLIAGALLAVAAARAGLFSLQESGQPLRDIVARTPMSTAAGERHRDAHFAELRTISALQELPTEFDRAEALYALAGRADSGELQALAYEAVRIADATWRERALSIVFFRLTELDPRTALAMAMTGPFRTMRSIESRVWRSWSRFDLDAALAEVSQLEESKADSAVQSIYGAIGDPYGKTAQRIEQVTGIPPNRSIRLRHLSRLAGDTPALALEFALALSDDDDRDDQLIYLGKLIAEQSGRDAEGLADDIVSQADRRSYLRGVYQALARTDRNYAFEQYFSIRKPGKLSKSETSQLQAVADEDLERALRIVESIDDGYRAAAAEIVAPAFARAQASQAIRWAQDYNSGNGNAVLQAVLKTVAADNPELALQVVSETEDTRLQGKLLQEVVTAASKTQPALAARLVDQLEDNRLRSNAVRVLGNEWLKNDPQSAIDWIMQQDLSTQQQLLARSGSLKNLDLDEAKLLMASVPADTRQIIGHSILQRVISERSAEEAFDFVRQFEGQPGYDAQLASVVYNVARENPDLAMQWAGRMPDGTTRDATISNIVGQIVRSDPAAAASHVTAIQDEDLRAVATSQMLSMWQRDDPEAAQEYLASIPRGPLRDNVLVSLAMYTQQDSRQALVDDIDNPDLRRQAELFSSLMEYRDNPDEMLRQLEAIDMPAMMRQQFKAEILLRAARGR